MKKIIKKSKTYFFSDKPIFGLDIGHDKLRVIQLDTINQKPHLIAYGSTSFDPIAIVDGVIVKPDLIAKEVVKLFKHGLVGDISTNRVAVSLPASHALTSIIQIPHLNPKEIDDAVRTEAEQYIPISTSDLYLDYSALREDKDGIEFFVVAMPKIIVDSYLILTRMLGLEAVLFDTAIGSSARLFSLDTRSDIPSVLVDFGSESTDITVFSHGLVVTGTVVFGDDHIINTIAKTLLISPNQASVVKDKYGLSLSLVQEQIRTAMEPSLQLLIKEIRRTVRYYEQRYTTEPGIGQVIIMGGVGNMPGLAEYLTEKLSLPSRTFDPTLYIDFGNLNNFVNDNHLAYMTAAGLAVVNPKEIFS